MTLPAAAASAEPELAQGFTALHPAEQLAVMWLQGNTNPKTRNAYAIDIGLPGPVRAQFPGGPATTKPLPPEAWIPWAISQGIDPAGELEVENVRAYAQLLYALHPDTKNTRRRRFTALGSFYAELRRQKLVYCDPTDLIGGRRGRKNLGLSGSDPALLLPPTEAQIRALYLAAQLDWTAHCTRNRALISVLSAAAPRVEELVGLDLNDYRRQSPTGHAMILLDGKGDKKRWQKLPARDADLVDAYLIERVPPPDSRAELALVGQVSHRRSVEQPLFTTGRGLRMDVDSIPQLLRRIANVPQIDDDRAAVRSAAYELKPIKDTITPHPFRAAYAVTAVNNGVPVTRVQEDLGHASLATTQNYLVAANVGRESASQVVSDRYHEGEVTVRKSL